MKISIKLSLCILGAVIGAGFATGKEISTFFMKYDNLSLFAIAISSFLFGIYIYFVMQKIRLNKIESPYRYISMISNEYFANFAMAVTYFLLFAIYCVMIAGCGEILGTAFAVSDLYASFVVSTMCCVVFIFGKKGILASGSILTPVMIFGIFWLGILTKKDAAAFAAGKVFDNYFTSSVIYVSYNTLPLLTLICELSSYFKQKKTCVITSLLTSFIIFFVMALIWYVLVKNDSLYLSYNMPLLKIAEKYGKGFRGFYVIVLFFAMITTALSSGFGLISGADKFIKRKHNNIVIIVSMCLFSLIMTRVGFSKLIDTLYPFFGYLGLSVFLLIIFDFLQNIKKNVKNVRKHKITSDNSRNQCLIKK